MESKIWLYQTNRFISENKQQTLLGELYAFSDQWQAHGKPLHSKFWFHNPFLLICEVDESLWSASGCSIDSKVRFLQNLGQKNNIDFFTRMKTIVLNTDGTFEQKDFIEVDPSREDQLIFNPTVLTSSQMPQLFTKPGESPMKKLFVYSGTLQR